MDLNYRAMLRMLGDLLAIIGVIMIMPSIVAFLYGESLCLKAFLCVGAGTLFLGIVIAASTRRAEATMRIRDGFLFIAIAWLIASAVCAVPFVITGAIPSYVDAFFEASSGLTTTGATIVPDIEALPRSILFWRSFSHWVGGMGILVFTIALLPEIGIGGQNIARAETPGPVFSKVSTRMLDAAKYLYIMYISYTAAEIVLLLPGGMRPFEAAVFAFGTIGTGGFSMYSDGIAHFDSAYIEGVITFFMLLSGTSFNLFLLTIKTGPKAILRDAECRLYIRIFLCASLFTMLSLMISGGLSPAKALRASTFQVASILTTTGYTSADYCLWPGFCQMVLLLLFFVGGCSGSTGSGVKVIRVLVLGKALRANIHSKLHPNVLTPIKVGDKTVPTETISTVSAYLFLYIAMVFAVGSLLSVADRLDLVESLTTAASCLANVGPAFGFYGPTSDFSTLSAFSKYLMSFTMIAGRLELYTIMLLFSRRFWNPYRY